MTVEELAEAVARAVLECDHVVRLAGSVATYLPGRLISGVAIRERPPEIEVRVVVPWGATVSDVSDEVRAAVRRIAPAVPLTLVIDDLDMDSECPPGTPERPEAEALTGGGLAGGGPASPSPMDRPDRRL